MKEIWKPIPDFPNYQVSSFGRVKSLSRSYSTHHYLSGKLVIKKTKDKFINGWPKYKNGKVYAWMIALRRDNTTYTMRIHILVLTAFQKSRPIGMECCHNDGNPSNNLLSNLRWGTHLENVLDSIRHGTKTPPPIHYGEKHPHAKLTDDIVRKIRSTKIVRGTKAQLAREFNISEMTVSRVVRCEGWRHVI